MSNLVKLNVTPGDKMFTIDWENVALPVGYYTTKVRVTVNNTILQLITDNHTLDFDYNAGENPLTGNTRIFSLTYGQSYIVSVTQTAINADGDQLAYTTGINAKTVSVSSSPDSILLVSNDTEYTVNDLTYIIVKAHFPTNYSNGGQPISHIQFLVTYFDPITNEGKEYVFPLRRNLIDDTYKLFPLPENKEFEITATAFNSVGHGSGPSNTIIEKTSGYPTIPATFNITTSYSISNDETKVLLAWTPPTNANLTDLLGYVIKYKLASETIYAERDVNGRTLVDGTVDVTADGTLIQNMSCEFLNEFTTDSQTYDFKIVPYNSLDISLQTYSTAVLQAYIFKNALQVQNVISVPGDSSLHLTWDEPTSLRGYPLEQYSIKVYTGSDTTGSFTTHNTFNKYLEITELENGQNMCVVILAQTKNTVTSEIIDGASVTIVSTDLNNMATTPFTKPTAPLVSSVVPRNGDIKLDWSPPTSDGGFPISHYVVSYKLHTESTYADVNIVDVGNVASYIIQGLTNGTSYDVELYAVNSATSTIYSTNKGTTFDQPNIKPYTSSNAITGLIVTPSDLQLDCIWDAPEITGGFDIDHYKVYLNNETSYQTATTASIILTGLSNGTSYTIKIVPYTKVDYLIEDLIGTLYESEGYYPYKPAGLVKNIVEYPTDTLVTLSWDAPDEDGGFPIDHYEVSYKTTTIPVMPAVTGKTSIAIVAPNGDNIMYTITPVTININPFASLAEIPGIPEIVFSRAYTTPEPITNLRVIPSDSSIKLLFVPSSDNGGYDITYYKISYKIGINAYDDFPQDALTLSYENGDIVYSFAAVNGSSYDIKIAVINAATSGNTSTDEFSFDNIPYRASDAVRDLLVNANDKQLEVGWLPPLYSGGFPIDHYDIYINSIYKDTTDKDTTDKIITGLTNGVYYVISVIPVTIPDYTSVNLNGTPNFAPDIKPYTSPDPVNNINVVGKDKEIVLSWSAPEIDGGNSIVGYELKMFDALNNEIRSVSNNESKLNYTFNNADPLDQPIVNGDYYTLKCRVITETDKFQNLYSSPQEQTVFPYGKPLEINYIIDIVTNIISITVNNNGFHISHILIVAPASTDSANNTIDQILVQNSIINPIEEQISQPLMDKFTVSMNYQLAPIEQQAMLIVVTNPAGMYFVQNFSNV